MLDRVTTGCMVAAPTGLVISLTSAIQFIQFASGFVSLIAGVVGLYLMLKRKSPRRVRRRR